MPSVWDAGSVIISSLVAHERGEGDISILHVRHVDPAKEKTGGGVDRIAQTAHARAPELLEALKVDVEDSEARGDAPDVGEGDTREVASPKEGQRDGTDQRQQAVTATLQYSTTLKN